MITAGHHPWLPSGWGPVGGELPMQPQLLIGHRAPQCPPPTSLSTAGAATSVVVVANAAQSSGHSCASQRPASPTRSQTPQLCAPNPSPPAHPFSRAAQLPRPLPLGLPGPVLLAPSPTRPVPPWPSPLRGPRPLHMAAPALRGALWERGGSEGEQKGRELALLLLVNAPRAGAKNRGGEIFRQSQDAFGRRRERGREGAGGGEERGRKERGGRKQRGTSVSKSTHSEPQRDSLRCGTQGRSGSGSRGLSPTETAEYPRWPGQDGHRQKPRSMHTGQTEGGLWAAQTHTRTLPHNGLLSMPGQGHRRGPQWGHHGRPTS